MRDNSRGGRYTIPSARLYPFQWNWDSCFCALGWAAFDEARAWKELETLFAHQWPGGMVPHIIFHEHHDSYFPGPAVWQVKRDVPTSGITQPPVAASIVRAIYERATDRETAERMARAMIPKLFLNHQWWHGQRDPDGTGLVAVYHPWETGRDNSPEWDAALKTVSKEGIAPYQRRDLDHVQAACRPSHDDYDRYVALVELFRRHDYDQGILYRLTPFKIADAGINFILLRANRDLLRLMDEIKYPDSALRADVAAWIARQEKAAALLWDDGTQSYCSRDLLTGRNIAASTSASFLSFYAGVAKKDEQIRVLERWGGDAEFMVPSLDPADPRFDRKRYWRGPVWVVVNFMIGRGLKEYGCEEQARRVGRDTARLIAEKSFCEYFDPLDGEGLGGNRFSWTAAVWLAWARDYYP